MLYQNASIYMWERVTESQLDPNSDDAAPLCYISIDTPHNKRPKWKGKINLDFLEVDTWDCLY